MRLIREVIHHNIIGYRLPYPTTLGNLEIKTKNIVVIKIIKEIYTKDYEIEFQEEIGYLINIDEEWYKLDKVHQDLILDLCQGTPSTYIGSIVKSKRIIGIKW